MSNEVLLAVGELRGLMIGIQNQLHTGSKRMDDQDNEIERTQAATAEVDARVQSVERRQSWLQGGLALLSGILVVAGIVAPIYFGMH